jgi:uncharacterized protein (TIGR03382 family)
VTFRLSTDALLDASDALIGDCFASPIASSASGPCSEPAGTVPAGFAGLAPGEMLGVHLFACADSLAIVPESDESNNCASVPTVLVPEPAASIQGLAGLVALWLLRRRRGRARSALRGWRRLRI